MGQEILDAVFMAIPQFCFGYPFVMAWYWMAGGVIFYVVRERNMPPPNLPGDLPEWPPISIIVPCHNEARYIEETLLKAAAADYPDFEIVVVNDGSTDDTASILDALALRIPNLRIVRLSTNQGKATALNAGALLAKSDILVCIDGDALLDPHALRWFARAFRRGDVGGVAGNPRIRNRTTVLGRIQVGEFSSVTGLVRRAQTTYGRLYTVSGVICAVRKRALDDAGWWSPRTVTDDIDVTWRVQIAGWRVVYEPNAIVWILMPETLRGLWSQRLRWAEGGVQMMVDFFWPMVLFKRPTMIPVYMNYVLSVIWAYSMVFSLVVGLLWVVGVAPPPLIRGFQLVPEWWGMTLALTYLAQALVSHLIERRYEPQMLRSLFWIIWYPIAFWMVATATVVVAVPRALIGRRAERTTWISPDRGLR
jgi:biofilm PGA synthesis N-glycosyltransferase PgaC